MVADDWRDTFCGREQELQRLVRRFEEVKQGQGPSLCVVLGDRGMGKTRLVQEFYRKLASEHDPQNYWPDASLFMGHNLRFAPDLADAPVRSHFESFRLEDRPMPFLWWGLRVSDSGVRNACVTDMAAHRRTLDWHLAPTFYARRLEAARAKLKEAGVDAGTELGKGLLKEAVKAIPGVGLAATALDLFLDYADKIKSATTAVAQERKLREGLASADVVRSARRMGDDVLSRTIDDLTELLAPASGLTALPVVLFCDDAQHACAGQDEGVLRLLSDLWQRAHLGGWPLMLVMTHWEVQWHKDAADLGRNCCARTFVRDVGSAQFGELITLPRESALEGMVRAGLPGLPDSDVRVLLDKADGNPQMLIELVTVVRGFPKWRGPGGALTAHARHEIEQQSTTLVALILERLRSGGTPEEVRRAAALSSVQGLQFLCELTAAAAGSLELDGVPAGLISAQTPHRLVAGVEEGVASFVQRAYREAASALVSGHVGDPAEVESILLRAAIAIHDNIDRWAGMGASERAAALGVIAGLGAESPAQADRVRAGQALLDLAGAAMTADSGRDFAQAAHFARKFEAGIGGKWPIDAFSLEDLDRAREAIQWWAGAAQTEPLARAALALAQSRYGQEQSPLALKRLGIQCLALGWALAGASKWGEAEAMYRDGLTCLRAVQRAGVSETVAAEVALALGEIAEIEGQKARFAEAHALSMEALGLARDLAARQEPGWSKRQLWIALMRSSMATARLFRVDEAYALVREALEVARDLHREWPGTRSEFDLIQAVTDCGNMARVMRRWDEAVQLSDEAVTRGRVMAQRVGSPPALRTLMLALRQSAHVAMNTQRWTDARALYFEALNMAQQLRARSATPAAMHDEARGLALVAGAAQALGDWEGAHKLFREGLAGLREVGRVAPSQSAQGALAAALADLAQLHESRQEWAEAEGLHRECVEICHALHDRRETQSTRRDLGVTLGAVARVVLAQGRQEEAQALQAQAKRFLT